MGAVVNALQARNVYVRHVREGENPISALQAAVVASYKAGGADAEAAKYAAMSVRDFYPETDKWLDLLGIGKSKRPDSSVRYVYGDPRYLLLYDEDGDEGEVTIEDEEGNPATVE